MADERYQTLVAELKRQKEKGLIGLMFVMLIVPTFVEQCSPVSAKPKHVEQGYKLFAATAPTFGYFPIVSNKGKNYGWPDGGKSYAACFFVQLPTAWMEYPAGSKMSAYLEDKNGNQAPVSAQLPQSDDPYADKTVVRDQNYQPKFSNVATLYVQKDYPDSFCESDLILKINDKEVGRWKVSGLRRPRRAIASNQQPKMQDRVLNRTISVRVKGWSTELFLAGDHDPEDQYEIKYAHTLDWCHGNDHQLWLQQDPQHDSAYMIGFGEHLATNCRMIHVYGTVTRYRTWEETVSLPPIHWFGELDKPGWSIKSGLGVTITCPKDSAHASESIHRMAAVSFQYSLSPGYMLSFVNCPLFQEYRKPMKIVLAGVRPEDPVPWWRHSKWTFDHGGDYPFYFQTEVPMPSERHPKPITGLTARLIYRVDLESDRFDLYVPAAWARNADRQTKEYTKQYIEKTRREFQAEKQENAR